MVLPSKLKLKEDQNKFTNYSANDPLEEDIDENYHHETLEKEKPERENRLKSIEKEFNEQENKWQKHQEILDARKLLVEAMKDADLLAKRDQQQENLDKLATDTHQEKQIQKIGDFNKDLDEIEDMINEQNESNLRRKPMENSMSTIKSSKNESVLQSKRDPFDKLEDIAKSVDQEELRKTAKSSKNKRKTWRTAFNTKNKVQNKTDYNQKKDEESYHSSPKIDKKMNKIQKSQHTEVRESGRYDYEFENTNERKIYEAPVEKDENPKEIEDYNIANESVKNSQEVFSPDNNTKRNQAKTHENFHIAHMTGFTDKNDLNNEVWNQNLQALKTNYLKVMTANNSKNKRPGDYRFTESMEDEDLLPDKNLHIQNLK